MYLQSREEYARYIMRTRPLCQLYSTFQTSKQLGEGEVWSVVEDDPETVEEDFGVVKADNDLVEDFESEASHRLPCLSPLSNAQVEVDPS